MTAAVKQDQILPVTTLQIFLTREVRVRIKLHTQT